ncbi:methyltransferase, FkbM family [Desulfocicer vacuolatum DSM 3385]|uniref:Methyltransferase, FkbM family n=1 Tax=Desulfocicer vacuolatum DSM 3385 TaxID=1121400 RepID=A0A1W2DK30_9BACT|nr:class I SAM-dependent methyltransferase [Desulfocicer vacuolatum]SMC97358.1 methyltransferase, FkbM family [Desulfocicer vacuolatum DSM 3385]
MELFPVNNEQIWRESWLSAIEMAPMTRRLIRTEEELIKRWDKVAQLFANNKRPPGNGNAEKTIIRRLREQNILKPGARVLDIGAGFGGLTFRLAETAGHITAVEPSIAMAAILKERVHGNGIKNVHVDQRRWQDINVEAEGLVSQFDLVVASMNPGVQTPEDLEKMNQVSRGFCYLSRFSGMKGFWGFDGIWELFFNEEPGMDPWDIIFPFNFLYALGYRPELDFIIKENLDKVPVEDAVKRILASLWNYMDETPAVKKTVEQFVMDRSHAGFVKYQKGFCQGVMIWQVAGPMEILLE